MPELAPFAAIRYAATEDLKDLVCPPYDVISPVEQRRLHERDPRNAVRVELPFSEVPDEAEEERYRRAGRQFRSWLEDGVLVRDPVDSFYVYRQDFRSADGARSVTGVIGALTLENWGPGGTVLPHERTMPGPVEDRLALLRACPANLSPIYAIYRGGSVLGPFLENLLDRSSAARVVDDHGTLHRMWVVQGPAELEVLAGAVRDGPLVIADGHHRYETALAYHGERRREPGQHGAVMCLCVDVDSEDVEVLPYHRLIRTDLDEEAIGKELESRFRTRAVTGKAAASLARTTAPHAFVFVLPHAELLVELDAGRKKSPDDHGPLDRLDVVTLHEFVLPEVFPGGMDEVAFTSDADRLISGVKNGTWNLGVLLRPLQPSDIIDVARAGERTPQKASYFSPKALTGLVFRSLE